jgi:hypothetical protein
MDPLGDLWSFDGDHIVKLRAELLETVSGEIGWLVVHRRWAPAVEWSVGA